MLTDRRHEPVRRLSTWSSLALALTLSAGFALPAHAQERGNPYGEWRYWGADQGSTRYSPLNQVNASNFENLELAWLWRGDNFGAIPDNIMRSTPIYADGKIYVVSCSGGAFVLEATPEMKLLSHNVIEDDTSVFNATPAVAPGGLILRSDRFLYFIGRKAPTK